MAKPKTPEEWFGAVEPSIAPIALALRDALNTAGPDLTKKLAWGFPCWVGNERIVSIIAHTDRCNLQLWSGNRLADQFPSRIEGTGKRLRHVKIGALEQIDDELTSIIAKAIELDRVSPEKVR
ncbi:MAG: DUF1801 domain-containing protein [Pseudomonadota bacterium]